MGKDTCRMVRAGMKADRVCGMLDEKELDTILKTMEYFEFRAGDPVVTQGDVGNTFFVTHQGTFEVSMNGNRVNTMSPGNAFGGLALLYNCPRTASVTACEASGVWGANGETFHMVLQENAKQHYAENRKALDFMKLFDGMPSKQKDRVGESFLREVVEPGSRVVTEGEAGTAMYFVKRGKLRVIAGAKIDADGRVTGGNQISVIQRGECFGERALLYNEPRGSTVVAEERCELLCVCSEQLKEVLGSDLRACLERNVILSGLKKSPFMSQLEPSFQSAVVQVMRTRAFRPGDPIDTGLRFAIVVDGQLEAQHVTSGKTIQLNSGDWFEEDEIRASAEGDRRRGRDVGPGPGPLRGIRASPDKGARVCMLTTADFDTVLGELGLEGAGDEEKMLLARKVPIFRHLNVDQTTRFIRALRKRQFAKGDSVFRQGDAGDRLYLIASGEVTIDISGKVIRTMGKNAFFGERSLIFNEPRSANVTCSSKEAALWYIDQAAFSSIVTDNMMRDLQERINRQDTSLTLKDLKHVKMIGAGAAGVVRLVEHKRSRVRYALKRVMKQSGKVPDEVRRECELLKENDHPFIMALVKVFETRKSVYMLTELITGGELHAAIRRIPRALSRSQAQFYTGSLVLVLEEISDRNIVFRDLKPENVMLDAQGYLKLIDFGIAKKLVEGSKTFTMIGTPHYMAPEVMCGHGYGTEVDVWSLGVMLFEFVCGSLPFAHELDEATDVFRAVLKDPLKFPGEYKDRAGRELMQGMLTRKPQNRIGSSLNGYEDIKNAEYFRIGHEGGSLFNKIMGRELKCPVLPPAETYCDPEDVSDIVLSDADELG
mmetsp:Transcript_124740/g.219664  ORF Transcript_124740/g.219664 Transcript_124740/m.219664 type:complete len:828 (-) Transcript_124740:267-2750(-)